MLCTLLHTDSRLPSFRMLCVCVHSCANHRTSMCIGKYVRWARPVCVTFRYVQVCLRFWKRVHLCYAKVLTWSRIETIQFLCFTHTTQTFMRHRTNGRYTQIYAHSDVRTYTRKCLFALWKQTTSIPLHICKPIIFHEWTHRMQLYDDLYHFSNNGDSVISRC